MHAVLLSLALATPVVRIPVQGALTGADGAPLDGAAVVTLAVYTVETGGTPAWSHTDALSFHVGAFSATIEANAALLSTFQAADAVWLAVAVDGVESARVPVGWAPFAYRAATADTLGEHAPDDFVLDTDPFPWAQVSGKPAWATTGYDAGFGLSLTGATFAAKLTDLDGRYLTSSSTLPWAQVSSKPAWAVNGYTAGYGLSLTGTTLDADTADLDARYVRLSGDGSVSGSL